MHTLQEFSLFTKGTAYILMLLFLVGAIFFWRFLVQHDDDRD